MIAINHNALLPHTAEALFDLVNDVESYPEYMAGCVGAEVLERDPAVMVARLDLARAGVKYSFTTRNHLSRPNDIRMELVDGPFSRFTGLWQFKVLNASSCCISLDLKFAVGNRIAAKAAGRLLRSVGDNLVKAVSKRADSLT